MAYRTFFGLRPHWSRKAVPSRHGKRSQRPVKKLRKQDLKLEEVSQKPRSQGHPTACRKLPKELGVSPVKRLHSMLSPNGESKSENYRIFMSESRELNHALRLAGSALEAMLECRCSLMSYPCNFLSSNLNLLHRNINFILFQYKL